MRYGTQAQILAFGVIFLVQPVSAVFYPVSALPYGLQIVSRLLPSSYVFEGMRTVIAGGEVLSSNLLMAFLTNTAYVVLSLLFFYGMFARAKRRGLLLKLE